jgi:hypothetical protein
MKSNIIMLCAVILFLGCSKEKNEDPASFVTNDYDSIVVKSYDSIVYVNIPYGESYYQFFPESDSVSFLLDIDKDNNNDFRLDVSHYLYVGSPHFRYNAQVISIVSMDTTHFQIAVQQDRDWSAAMGFDFGDTLNSSLLYHSNAGIIADAPYATGNFLSGNTFIAFRKGTNSSGFRYGYLNLIVDGAKVILVKSVMNTNKDMCIVGDQ